jgi:hypothetical protein
MGGLMKTLQTLFFVAHFSLVMILLGGTIFSVMVEYPNWFADVPTSLATTRDFYRVLHPGYFFQIIGPLTLLTGIGFVAAGWRISNVRNLVLVGLAFLVAAELLTFIYIYPRLDTLFFGLDIHKAETLKQAAAEFTFADRIRTGLGVLASAFAVAALVRLFGKTGEVIE